MLRLTARAFVVSGFSYAAAASSLHIHRNTALQRIKKAEALRGRPFTERPAELLAASLSSMRSDRHYATTDS